MEFPNTGVQCSVKECKQLDFLPFVCDHCSNTYCKEHYPVPKHLCPKYNDNIADGTEKTVTFNCSQELCSNKSPVQMPCVKCKKHFCLTHRFHECFKTEENKLELEKYMKSKKEFGEVKAHIDQEIHKKLQTSRNSAMAAKIQLMKLKGKSVGPKNIPIAERRYFLVHPPIKGPTKSFEGTKAVFVSETWCIGKVIDSIADSLKISNSNNLANVEKLRMFHYSSGNIVSDEMNEFLSEFYKNNCLIDGQDIILEYSNSDKIDNTLYE